VLLGFGLNAQVVDSAQLLIKYVPKLANSNKINQQAVLRDTVVSEKMEFNYVVAPAKPQVQFAAGDMQVGKLNPEVKERYYRNYIKLGFGYLKPEGVNHIWNVFFPKVECPASVMRMPMLTPGDFNAVNGRLRYLPESARTADRIEAELRKELSAKDSHAGRTMGF
jgi:hypothetical protein